MARKRGRGQLALSGNNHPDTPVRLFYLNCLLGEFDKMLIFTFNGETRQRIREEVSSVDWNGSWLSLSSTPGKRRIFTFRRHGANADRPVAALCHEDRRDADFFFRLSRGLARRFAAVEFEVRQPVDFDNFYHKLLRLEYFEPLITADIIPPRDPYQKV